MDQIDKDPDISPSSKKEKWQELLNAYSMDNPYSDGDERYRKYAAERIKDLEKGKDDPFGKEIKNRAKKIYKNSKGFWEADYGEGIVMVYIPAGEFTMDSNDGDDDEKPPHTVYLDGYWIGKYEVTFEQYDKYCDETQKKKPKDRRLRRGKHPVSNLSWYDAAAYCEWLSKKTGLKFALPTEAQWEKAGRGADGRKYPWGSHNPYYNGQYYANCRPVKYEVDGYRYTAPVGSFPNGVSPYGLLDMAGNVWEWCSDWYDKNYYKNSPKNNPTGPINGSSRVGRGGDYVNGVLVDALCQSR